MNCTIIRGRFHDEVVCTRIAISGIPISIAFVMLTLLVLIVIRVDKVMMLVVNTIQARMSGPTVPRYTLAIDEEEEA